MVEIYDHPCYYAWFMTLVISFELMQYTSESSCTLIPRIGEFLKNYGLKVLRVKWIEIGRVFVKPGCSFSKDWGNKTWSVHQHVINKTDVLLHALGPDFYLLHVKRWISYFENLLNGSEWNHRVHMLCYKFKTCLLNFIFFCDQKWLKASFLC